MDYLENLLTGNIAAFRKQIEGKIAEKVFDKLATRKQQIANGLFEDEKELEKQSLGKSRFTFTTEPTTDQKHERMSPSDYGFVGNEERIKSLNLPESDGGINKGMVALHEKGFKYPTYYHIYHRYDSGRGKHFVQAIPLYHYKEELPMLKGRFKVLTDYLTGK